MPHNILGIRIDSISKKEALGKIQAFLTYGQHSIFTPNPEMLVAAHKDDHFRGVLNAGSLNICDGSGIQFFLQKPIERIPGVDFMADICKLAEREGKSIYLLGAGKTGGPDLAVKRLKEQFPDIHIAGFHSGPSITSIEEGIMQFESKEENRAIVEKIRRAAPDILFVAFGHKKQEEWIAGFLESLPSVRIAMGVGGAFDFIAGVSNRAPQWMRTRGIEWVYRLILEPKRIGRIWNAIIVFPYRFFRYRS